MKVGLVTQEVQQDMGLAMGEMDDEGGGVSLNAQSRANLMQKLARGEMQQPDLGPAPSAQPSARPQPVVPAQPSQPPSPFLVLKNMFDPAEYATASVACV